MRVTVNILGSGSSGNAALISSSRTRLLFDIGFGKKELLNRFAQINVAPEGIDAVFVSHEHADHIGGLRGFCKEFRRPVFMTDGTWHATRIKETADLLEKLRPGQPICFQDFVVHPLPVSHDAVEPVAFMVVVEGIKIALLVDLGEITPAICGQIQDSHCLILESNHDVEMLRVGPYPWVIKQRVMSAQGHLSNSAAGQFLATQYDGNAEYIVLAHISQVNNHPDIARLTAQEALRSRPKRSLFGSHLRMAFQDCPAEPLYL